MANQKYEPVVWREINTKPCNVELNIQDFYNIAKIIEGKGYKEDNDYLVNTAHRIFNQMDKEANKYLQEGYKGSIEKKKKDKSEDKSKKSKKKDKN